MLDFQNSTTVELFMQLDAELNVLKESIVVNSNNHVDSPSTFRTVLGASSFITKYIVSIEEEIYRLLITPKANKKEKVAGRVMRPDYGSELYKLRDREMNEEWRLLATQYTFVAINRHIERVRCRKVLFEVLGDGKLTMKLKLEQK